MWGTTDVALFSFRAWHLPSRLHHYILMYTGKNILVWKVLWLFCFEICTPEGRGGEKGGSANFETKHTEPFIPEYFISVYFRMKDRVRWNVPLNGLCVESCNTTDRPFITQRVGSSEAYVEFGSGKASFDLKT